MGEQIEKSEPLTEEENAQYEALQGVSTFEDLCNYLDAYSKKENYGRGDFQKYQILDSIDYDMMNIKRNTNELKEYIRKIEQGVRGTTEHDLSFLPGELRSKIKELLEKVNKK